MILGVNFGQIYELHLELEKSEIPFISVRFSSPKCNDELLY